MLERGAQRGRDADLVEAAEDVGARLGAAGAADQPALHVVGGQDPDVFEQLS